MPSNDPSLPEGPSKDDPRSASSEALVAVDEVGAPAVANDLLASLLERENSHRGKFRVAYGVLGALAVAALIGFAVLFVRGGSSDPPPWSEFVPTAEGIGAAEEAAAFVESRYTFENGVPIVDISADSLTLQNEPIDFVAIERPDINGRTDQLLLPVTSSVKFGLCGEGEQCAITRGEASAERQRYLRRASLELALQTFRNVPEVESVVTYLPPTEGTEPTWALFFEREQFASFLEAPLAELLAPTPLAAPEYMTDAEAALVDELTVPILYSYEFWETEEAETVLGLVAAPAE